MKLKKFSVVLMMCVMAASLAACSSGTGLSLFKQWYEGEQPIVGKLLNHSQETIWYYVEGTRSEGSSSTDFGRNSTVLSLSEAKSGKLITYDFKDEVTLGKMLKMSDKDAVKFARKQDKKNWRASMHNLKIESHELADDAASGNLITSEKVEDEKSSKILDNVYKKSRYQTPDATAVSAKVTLDDTGNSAKKETVKISKDRYFSGWSAKAINEFKHGNGLNIDQNGKLKFSSEGSSDAFEDTENYSYAAELNLDSDESFQNAFTVYDKTLYGIADGYEAFVTPIDSKQFEKHGQKSSVEMDKSKSKNIKISDGE
jgi:hypothetical protein